MPVFGHEITLQVDLATTAIAVMAFLVSVWLGWRQSRLDVESLRQQRDTDITIGAIPRLVPAATPRCCSGGTTPLWLSPTFTNASASRCWKNCPAP
jgi:hypothetical protein